MIAVTATFKTKQGREEEFIAEMKQLAKSVKDNEPGAIDYTIHRSQKSQSVFLIYEKYESDGALKAHMAAPHFQNAAKKLPELLDGPMQLDVYEIVG